MAPAILSKPGRIHPSEIAPSFYAPGEDKTLCMTRGLFDVPGKIREPGNMRSPSCAGPPSEFPGGAEGAYPAPMHPMRWSVISQEARDDRAQHPLNRLFAVFSVRDTSAERCSAERRTMEVTITRDCEMRADVEEGSTAENRMT